MNTTVLTDEQIGDLYQDWYCFFKDNPGSAALCIRAIEQAVLQSPEVQAWRAMSDEYNELIRHIHSGGDALEFLSNRAAMEAQKWVCSS